MTELEILQAKHREEAARRRVKLKERKQRTRRLIERGAILEIAFEEGGINCKSLEHEELQALLYQLIHLYKAHSGRRDP